MLQLTKTHIVFGIILSAQYSELLDIEPFESLTDIYLGIYSALSVLVIF
jgi:hypothetical protein